MNSYSKSPNKHVERVTKLKGEDSTYEDSVVEQATDCYTSGGGGTTTARDKSSRENIIQLYEKKL